MINSKENIDHLKRDECKFHSDFYDYVYIYLFPATTFFKECTYILKK